MIGAAWLLALQLISPSNHRFVAFESLMPVKAEPQTLVTHFSYRDLYQNVHEAYFTIRSKDAASLPEAIVVTPVDRSIQQQLLELHMADRTMPFESVLAKVTVRRQALSSGACGAINVALDTLRKLRFGMPQRDLVVLHPTVHRIVVRLGGDDIDFSLQEDEHPLALWAQRTLAGLQRCRSGE